MTTHSIALRCAVASLAAAAPLTAQAPSPQPEILACYDSRTSSTGTPLGSGIVYRIKVAGVVGQQGCVDPKHTPFSWTIQHGALTGLSNDDHPQYLLANGTRQLAGNLGAGGFRITGLGAGTVAGDAVRFEQALKGGDPAGGDLTGPYPNPRVNALQGRALSGTPPTDGNVLTFNATTTTWEPRPAAAASGTSANSPNTLVQRDATGGFAAGTVTAERFQGDGSGLSVPASSIVAGIIPLARLPAALVVGGDAAGGDLTGSYPGPRVNGLQGRALSGTPPTDGNVLTFNATTTTWEPRSAPAASGTSANTSNTLVERDAAGGFAAGAVTLGPPPLGSTRALTVIGDAAVTGRLTATIFDGSSNVNRKEHFRDVDGETVLGKIARLPMREWNYKAQDPSIRHLGPTAQDFRAAFGLGESDTTIATVDIDGVTLLGVQALERRTREQANEITALRAELAALRAEIAERRK